MIQLNKNILKVLDETSKLLYDKYKDKLIEGDINSSSNLYNTLTFEVVSNEQSYQIRFNAQDYWKNIEYGRKPGKFPNIEAIKKWIEVKPVIPRPYNGKIPTSTELAFLIARSIARKGIPAKNILQKTLDEIMEVQTEKIKAAIGDDFTLQVGLMMELELSSDNIKIKI